MAEQAGELERMRELLSRLDELYRAVSFATGALLGAASWEDRIEEVLQRLGEATGASGVYTMEARRGEDGEAVAVLRHEWAGPGYPRYRDNPKLRSIPVRAEGFAGWASRLRSGEPIYGPVRDLPECVPFLAAAGLQDMASIAVVPVFAGGEYWGGIGFHQYGQEREWTAIEMEALRSASLVLGEAIHLRRTRDAMEESQERWRLLAENVPDIVATLSRDGSILGLNRTVSGLTPEEVVGTSIYDYTAPEHHETVRRSLERVFHAERPEVYEVLAVLPDGTNAWIETRVVPVERDGHVVAATFIGTDITERKRAAEALAQSEQRYQDLFENSVLGIYRTTPDGRILEANPALVRMLGYPSFEELAQRNLEAEGFEPNYERSAFRELMESAGQITGLESAWTRRDGTTVLVRENAKLVRDESGRVLYYEGTVEDVTERKRAEEELSRYRDRLEERVQERTAELTRANEDLQREVAERRKAEEALRTSDRAIASSVSAVAMSGPEGNLTYVNRSFLRLWGYGEEGEVLGRQAQQFWQYPHEAGAVIEALRVHGSWTGELTAKRRDGSLVDVLLSASTVTDERGEPICLMASFMDITERKQAEEALRQSEAKYRAVVEHIPAITYTAALDEVSTTLYLSPQIESLLGFAPGDYETVHEVWLGSLHPEDRARVLADVARAHATGEPFLSEYRMIAKDGRVLWFRDQGSISRDEQGNPLYLEGVMFDITERKRSEEALRVARRKLMTARGEERRRVARELHDSVSQRIIAMNLRLRNLFAALPSIEGGSLAAAVSEVTQQSSELIQEIRQISHGLYPPTLEQLGLCSALAQLVQDCQPHQVQAATRCDPACRNVRFAGEVEIALFRIAQEAVNNVLRHARAEHVELALVYEDGHVVLQVIDDGVGFAPSSAARGLGLSSMQDRARSLEGALEITSRPGGTIVEARIPARPRGPEAQDAQAD